MNDKIARKTRLGFSFSVPQSNADPFSSPRRAWEVQSLKIYIPCYNEEPGDLDGAFVGYLGRLRDLNVRFPEMPKGVDKHDDVARTRRFLSLQSLRTCESFQLL